MAEKKVAEQYYTRPPKLGKWEGFSQFIWNGETSQFMGRTAGSWAKILLFYLIFYAVLVGFFGAMLAVFWQTLEADKPKWQLENGLIGSNPGLGFRPMPPEANVGSTLIWYKSQKPDNVQYWINTTDEFLSMYQSAVNKDNQVDCDFHKLPEEGKICKVDLGTPFGFCTQNKPEHERYGFSKKSPCIFLKLNKIYNWVPQLYNDSKNVPKEMPEELKTSIDSEKNPIIWVSCEGENPADVENIGAISYYPKRGFPAYYFPYKNTLGYLPPIVAVHFERPRQGVLINIECKAWAKNIKLDRADRKGSVHFELMID